MWPLSVTGNSFQCIKSGILSLCNLPGAEFAFSHKYTNLGILIISSITLCKNVSEFSWCENDHSYSFEFIKSFMVVASFILPSKFMSVFCFMSFKSGILKFFLFYQP